MVALAPRRRIHSASDTAAERWPFACAGAEIPERTRGPIRIGSPHSQGGSSIATARLLDQADEGELGVHRWSAPVEGRRVSGTMPRYANDAQGFRSCLV